MTETYREIQGFSPRFDTFRQRVSTMGWQYGLGNFFIQDIPFSASVGAVLGGRFADAIGLCLRQQDKTDFHIFEVGAGSGLLAIHILDALEKRDPRLYRLITFHITENHPEMLRQLSQNPLFARHSDHLVYEVLDITAPQWSVVPDVVILSYVLDSLPVRLMRVKDGEPYEVIIRSLVPDTLSVWDTSDVPERLGSEAALARFASADGYQQLKLGEQIVHQIVEEWALVRPLFENGWTTEELACLSDIPLPAEGSFFNFSPVGISQMQSLQSTVVDQGGLVLVHDLGHINQDVVYPLERMLARYGTSCFHTIYFPAYTMLGSRVFQTRHRDGASQIMAYLPKNLAVSDTLFSALFSDNGVDGIAQAVRQLSAVSDPLEYEAVRTLALSRLSEGEQLDYSLNINIAADYVSRELWEPAIARLQFLCDTFGGFSLSAQFLLGHIYRRTLQFDRALAVLEPAYLVSPEYIKVAMERCLVYFDMKEYDKLEAALVEGIRRSGFRCRAYLPLLNTYCHLMPSTPLGVRYRRWLVDTI